MKIKTFFTTALLLSTSILSFSQKITFEELDFTAKQITEVMCPKMIDYDTRFDNCKAIPSDNEDLIIQYNYTLVNYTCNDIVVLFGSMDKAKEIMGAILLNNVKTNDSMRQLRDNDMTFIFSYRDKYQDFVFDIKIKPKDYKDY
jgi:hypothetical protein